MSAYRPRWWAPWRRPPRDAHERAVIRALEHGAPDPLDTWPAEIAEPAAAPIPLTDVTVTMTAWTGDPGFMPAPGAPPQPLAVPPPAPPPLFPPTEPASDHPRETAVVVLDPWVHGLGDALVGAVESGEHLLSDAVRLRDASEAAVEVWGDSPLYASMLQARGLLPPHPAAVSAEVASDGQS